MDERDAAILCHLMRDPRAAAEAVGRAIGISGAAVSARMDRMHRAGILNGYAVTPRASALGLEEVVWGYDAADEPEKPRSLPADVVWISRVHPGMLFVGQQHRSGETPQDPPDMAGLGLPTMGPNPFSQGVRADDALSKLDWRIIQAILPDARAPLSSIARQARLTTKTVRRRLDALLQSKSLLITPNIDATREPGFIVGQAYVSLAPQSPSPMAAWPGCVQIGAHPQPRAVVLFGALPSLPAVRDLERTLHGAPGVLQVDFVVPKEFRCNEAYLEAAIHSQLEQWGNPRAQSS